MTKLHPPKPERYITYWDTQVNPNGTLQEVIAALTEAQEEADLYVQQTIAKIPDLVLVSAAFEEVPVGWDEPNDYRLVVRMEENEVHYQQRLTEWKKALEILTKQQEQVSKEKKEKTRQEKIKALEKQLAQLKGQK